MTSRAQQWGWGSPAAAFFLTLILPVLAVCLATAGMAADPARWVTYDPPASLSKGKHIVFMTGDEEYRSEEGMPQLARILTFHHGFKCTVLFSLGENGEINPDNTHSLEGAAALDTADLIVMQLRFREYPDAVMKHFVDAYLAGKPIIALRTSTHSFNYSGGSTSAYKKYHWMSKDWPGGFGKQVLGETWVAHHGDHKKEATRGIIEAGAEKDPILRGVKDLFGDTDVYTAAPPADAKILVRGQVLVGMKPTDAPVVGKKNEPMQPVVWTRTPQNEAGKVNKVLCTTMGSATDLQNEGLRRLLVNGVYWGLDIRVPRKAKVDLVGEYKPTMYGFKGYKKGVRPADLAWPPVK